MDDSHKEHIIRTYQKRATNYDITANLYYLFGYREWAYRRMAVKALKLKQGDTVLDLACGTGINFPLYQQSIGPSGRIIGVDLTPAMLVQAQKRVKNNDWQNVALIHHDAATYRNTSTVDAVISTYAFSIFPNIEQVIKNVPNLLQPYGRFVLLELQIPSYWPKQLAKIAVALMKPFALDDEWVKNRPWELIQRKIRQLFIDVHVEERYFGLTYIISGEMSPE